MMRGGRGGRGGRGRGGRGGGGGGGGGRGLDVIGDTAEELGLTFHQMDALGNQPPPLYPQIEYPDVSELTEMEESLITTMRELTYRMAMSPHYLSGTKDSSNQKGSAVTVLSSVDFLRSLTESDGNNGIYFPAELLADRKVISSFNKRGGISSKANAVHSTFEQLQERENALGESTHVPGENEKETGDDDNDLEEDDDWGDEDGDYDKDYYASGGEDSGGDDDNEPVY